MKPGDLVEAMRAKDLKVLYGMVIKKLPPIESGPEVFEVMTSDGHVTTYTETALRSVK